MIHDRNIVCVASSWFDHPTSKHHVMRILSERNNVVWVNFHASRRPTFSKTDASAIVRRLRRAWSGPQRVLPGLDVLSPVLVPLPESRLVRSVNVRLLVGQIQKALSRLPNRPTQLWLFTPDIPELTERMSFERVVYYCVDDFAAFSGFNTELIEGLETRTIAASDAVITTSVELYEGRRQQHANTHLMPHGVDFEHFAAAMDMPAAGVPEDIQRIPRPILGYLGLLSDYLDMGLLAQAARRRPDWSFVLIGDSTCPVERPAGVRNIHLLGGRRYEDLPAYCARFDVGLIPFRMNRLVRAVNPIKLREYLAAGLPVVSSPMEAVMGYVPGVYPAQTLDEFLAACTAALAAGDEASCRARQELVRYESWRCRVERVSRMVMGDAVVAAGSRDEGRSLATPVGAT